MEIAIVTKDRPSILEGTLTRLEAVGVADKTIIVDGSENEDTKLACQEFPVHYYQQESSGGRISAREEALSHCTSDAIAYIDDDVIVSDTWYDTLRDEISRPDVVGATGKLINEYLPRSGPERFVRSILYGSEGAIPYVGKDGTVGGQFNQSIRTEVDHLPGCNMAYDTSALQSVNAFDTDFNRGNAYREENIMSHRVKHKGKLIYNPSASLEHLKADENRMQPEALYSIAYNSRLFLSKESLIQGWRNHLKHIVKNLLENISYLAKYGLDYRHYLYGELKSIFDCHISRS